MLVVVPNMVSLLLNLLDKVNYVNHAKKNGKYVIGKNVVHILQYMHLRNIFVVTKWEFVNYLLGLSCNDSL